MTAAVLESPVLTDDGSTDGYLAQQEEARGARAAQISRRRRGLYGQMSMSSQAQQEQEQQPQQQHISSRKSARGTCTPTSCPADLPAKDGGAPPVKHCVRRHSGL